MHGGLGVHVVFLGYVAFPDATSPSASAQKPIFRITNRGSHLITSITSAQIGGA